jgi:hypothetical protein
MAWDVFVDGSSKMATRLKQRSLEVDIGDG